MKDNRPPGCEHCKKQCTIHLTQIINGQVEKLDMCDTCPKAKQMQDPLEFGLMEQLMGLAMQPGVPMTHGIACEACGYTEAQFRKTGRMGCPECYKVFIMPKIDILNKIHGAIMHKGKVPRLGKAMAVQQNLIELKELLNKFVKEEAYEEAAKVRDQIKALNEKIEAERLANIKPKSKKVTKPKKKE